MNRATLLLALLVVQPLAGCVDDPGPTGSDRLQVVTSTYPLTYLAQRIGGDNVTVETLVGAGQEPHAWSPTVGDVQTVRQADLLVLQGAGMDPWGQELLRALGDDGPRVLVATEGLPLLEGGHRHQAGENGTDESGNASADEDHSDEAEDHDDETDEHGGEVDDPDPHVWQDPALYADQARMLVAELEALDPANAEAYRQRLDVLLDDLEALDQAYRHTLEGCRVPFIIANHNAFAYAAERYGFGVEALFGRSAESEAPPDRFRELVGLARDHDVPIVFREDLSDPRTMQRLANEADARVEVLHTVGSLTEEQAQQGHDYRSLMEVNLDRLAQALDCPP